MFKKVVAIISTLVMCLGFAGCAGKTELPEYESKEFEISGFWAPHEITEESFTQYKNAGLNTLAMINHSGDATSEEQFYLGSDRTQKALELCRKVGLDAILNYNDWMAIRVEEDENYYSETPFSQYDIYGDYKDIIKGVHICDEPKFIPHFEQFSNKTLIEDFKKVYPNADYIVNLVPMYGARSYGYFTNENMIKVYGESFMSNFENPYISVDIYPFNTKVEDVDKYIAKNYEDIANGAKEYGAEKTFIVQSATGGDLEENLSENDMRWLVYNALAFGVDNLQYYCYSVPYSTTDDGSIEHMYNYCILNPDNTPSKLYGYVKEINNEIQSFADAFLSYDWDMSLGIYGTEHKTYRLESLMYDDKANPREFTDEAHYVSATATQDLLVSRFTSEKYGEAYTFLNYAERNNSNTAVITFKDCKSVAIYGGDGFDGTPEIVKLNKEGKLTLELDYGEGVFVTPIV